MSNIPAHPLTPLPATVAHFSHSPTEKTERRMGGVGAFVRYSWRKVSKLSEDTPSSFSENLRTVYMNPLKNLLRTYVQMIDVLQRNGRAPSK